MKVIRNGRLETTNTRADNRVISKTVTIKKGDTLYKLGKMINKKKPKTGKKKIISLNKATLSKWSKAYRKASAKNKKKYIRNGSYRLKIGGTIRIKQRHLQVTRSFPPGSARCDLNDVIRDVIEDRLSADQ